MKCVPTDQGKQLLLKVHAEIYRHHVAPRSLVKKGFHQGFYWPTMLRDAEAVVRRCEEYQFYAQQTHLSTQELQTIPITWPFMVWGLDMVGPLKKSPDGFTHLLIAVDKFTKWIEAPTFIQKRRSSSSLTSSTGSAFLTVSSLTTELTSSGRSS